MARKNGKTIVTGDQEDVITAFDEEVEEGSISNRQKDASELPDPYGEASLERKIRGFRIEMDLYYIMDKLKDIRGKKGERDFLSNLVNKLVRQDFEEKGLFEAYKNDLKVQGLWREKE